MCENCDIDILVIVNMYGDQINELSNQLIERKFYFTRINTGGGILSMTSNSLLIGIQSDRYSELKYLLRSCCKRKLTQIPTQINLESHIHVTQPMAIEAEVGGANVHSIAVEHFEQF